jgi:hypothetical protein
MKLCPTCNNLLNITMDQKLRQGYYICDTCNKKMKIVSEEILYHRSVTNVYNVCYDTSDIIYDVTLPRTKRYNCTNKQCETHKTPDIKEAIFYRLPNSYAVKYVCTVCTAILEQ